MVYEKSHECAWMAADSSRGWETGLAFLGDPARCAPQSDVQALTPNTHQPTHLLFKILH